ncbi:hypothetical protein Q5P01_025605 [Channa striata]|uniref:Peptidase S1 domain-containing protein n=1 Tax=Channa striata TaxID=64152 RepID=A0AA88J5S7_CHASR|nr:hypothetical protein Q5P01_025605 [Channa striata]
MARLVLLLLLWVAVTVSEGLNLQKRILGGLQNDMKTNYPQFYAKYEYQHWFCGEAPGVDQCPGDSGGGVVHGNTIYGVMAFSNDQACAKPAGYMNICHQEYLDWITKTITT